MTERTIAERLFDATYAEAEIEESLHFDYESIGWDYYDCSLEVHGVAPDTRLDQNTFLFLKRAGFCQVYVNHTDKWETHYGMSKETPEPWRVSYPHKRGDGGGIWVQQVPESWPKEWLASGYIEVKG